MERSGRIRATARAAYPLHVPRPGLVEQSPVEWWQATVRAIRQCLEQVDGAEMDLQAMSLSGHMSALVLVDQRGQPALSKMFVGEMKETDPE